MSIDRRAFLLRGTSVATLATTPWQLWASPAGDSNARLLLIFLRGAYDSLSAFAPHAEPYYHEARPTLALAGPDPHNVKACLDLDGRWGLHPALVDTVGNLWAEGQFGFVPFAGAGFVSRSHFDAQDRIEAGALGVGVRDGFLARTQRELGGGRASAVAVATQLPLALRGGSDVTTVALDRTAATDLSPDHLQRVLATYAGHPLESRLREAVIVRRQTDADGTGSDMGPARSFAPADAFAAQSARVGHLLREHSEYRIGMVDVGGWDTHIRQGTIDGALASRLGRLGRGIDTLRTSLGVEEWRRTVVVVVSEFGRTVRENGTLGTDHGHGTTMWVAGGGVRGGRAVGEQAPITPGRLYQGRDLPVLNEYFAVLGGLLGRMYGLRPEALARIFPGTTPTDLGLL